MARREVLRPDEILAILNELEEEDSDGEDTSNVLPQDSDDEFEIGSNSESSGESSSDEDSNAPLSSRQGQ